MPIPSPLDRKLAEIDDAAAGITISLRSLRHTPGYDPRLLRERLQLFVDIVTETANEIIATR
jgi:hypothetical protein